MISDERVIFGRLRLVGAAFAVLGLVIVGQLFRIGILQHDFYSALASDQHEYIQRLFPARGKILARDPKTGVASVLATNRKLALVYAEPPKIADAHHAAYVLAPILQMDEIELYGKLSDVQYRYRPIKRQLDDETKAKVEALGLAGIGLVDEDWRYYPEGTAGAQMLGFVGSAADGGRKGLYGIEGWFNRELTGTSGALTAERDSLGHVIATGVSQGTPAKDGDNLVLTIDRTVEYRVCHELEAWVAKYQAERGSVVILDPKTGAIIAMCNAPTFDPNTYSQVHDASVYNNTAIFGAYEPGSVFKTITMAAALEAGKVAPDTLFDDPGEVRIGPHVIRNSDLKAHGLVTMREVLALSLNTGMVEVVSRLGTEAFRQYVNDFGFGAKSGIELQTEVAGSVASLEKAGDIWSATASFGQGITVTPLQLALAYGAIANGGTLMKPMIVAEIDRPDGTKAVTRPSAVRRVVSERTAQQMTAMLTNVVEEGHGKRAGVPGYWVAGKTGTAQISRSGGGGYEADSNIGSFAGFAPASDPKFVMVVRVDRPQGVQFAESSAAPLFGDIAKFLLDYYEVPPTRPVK